jgi:hypothetical protein
MVRHLAYVTTNTGSWSPEIEKAQQAAEVAISIAMLRMFSALLAGANGMPTARFLLFNVAGGICFGAIALGAEIYKISETLSVISLGLLIAAGYAFPIFVRRNEAALHRRAVEVLRDHLRGWPASDKGRAEKCSGLYYWSHWYFSNFLEAASDLDNMPILGRCGKRAPQAVGFGWRRL